MRRLVIVIGLTAITLSQLCTASNAKSNFSPQTAQIKSALAVKKVRPNPIPISLPVGQSGPITFANLSTQISEISAVAYESVQSIESKNAQPRIPVRIYVGPNTTPNVADVNGAFTKIIKFWSGYTQPKRYYALLFSFQDKAWAINQAKKMPPVKATGGIKGGTGILSRINQCKSDSDCSGANSGIAQKSKMTALGQFGMAASHNSVDPYFQTGGIQGHEYTHAVQSAQFVGTKNASLDGAMQRVTPCWLIEGQANYLGTAAEAASFEDFMKWRSTMPKAWPIPEFTDYSSASILHFLQTTKPNSCLPPNPKYQLGYGIGALIVESLTAIGGAQSTMALLTTMSTGANFNQAFQIVYGISWDEAAPILAQVVATEYAATP
jgi:hypothetical protein